MNKVIRGIHPHPYINSIHNPTTPTSLQDLGRIFGTWTPGDKEAEPTADKPNVQSQKSGGTAHILPRERRNATFNPALLTLALDGWCYLSTAAHAPNAPCNRTLVPLCRVSQGHGAKALDLVCRRAVSCVYAGTVCEAVDGGSLCIC